MMRARLLIIVLVAAALGCLTIVLSDQYASGNVYPEYSSQRTDRLGAAALYEALAKTYPDVSRNVLPLRSLAVKNSDVLIVGLSPMSLGADDLDAFEAVAKNGNRVVIGLDGGAWIFRKDTSAEPLESRWRVRLLDTRRQDAMMDPERRQRQTLAFQPIPGSAWKPEGKGISKAFGTGSVLLLGSSWVFTNQALRYERDLDALTQAVGKPSHIVFDETHLGSVEQGTVMGLARRLRMQGAIAVALVCALLFIWQASMPFPPERVTGENEARLAAASAGEALRNLLTHHIPAGRIMTACVAEWRRDRGRLVAPEKLARIENIAARPAHPVTQWREIRAVLDLKTRTGKTQK